MPRLGDGLVDLGRTATPGVIGELLEPVPGHASHLLDRINRVVLRVAHDGMELPPGTGSPLSVDAPVIYLGGEFLRYGTCEQFGTRDYRIWELSRGCFGSETNIATHQIGDMITLVEPNSIFRIDNSNLVTGSDVAVEAVGLGDVQPVLATLSSARRALRPLAPVHGQAARNASGDLAISWCRRTRYDTGWRDFTDVPLAENQLLFDVRIAINSMPLDEFLVAEERLLIPSTRVAAWGVAAGSELQFAIRQVGQYDISEALRLNIYL